MRLQEFVLWDFGTTRLRTASCPRHREAAQSTLPGVGRALTCRRRHCRTPPPFSYDPLFAFPYIIPAIS